MEVSLFVRQPNSTDYSKLDKMELTILPRPDEFLSATWEGSKKYFQVIAVHHLVEEKGAVEVYAVQTDPPWEIKKQRAIGFGGR